MDAKKSWTYEQSGVPHLKGDERYNRKVKQWIASTHIPGVLGNRTGFASIFDPRKTGFKDPLIVTSTDGVGTKLDVAALQGRHDTIGIDLVAMCVNDIITTGARPVIFLDYYAAGKFDSGIISEVLKGVTQGCRQAGCALVGGETAIMPGFYQTGKGHSGQYDVAGFSVGLVERKMVLDGRAIKNGDLLIGIASSGVHSNGFSLVRKVLSRQELKGSVGREVLTPTRIYVKPVLQLLEAGLVKGVVNITGGGFVDNVPRILPKGLGAQVWQGSWPIPEIFKYIQKKGRVNDSEMMRTFNMGIGMILAVRPQDAARTQYELSKLKWMSWVMGETVRGSGVEVK